MKLTYGDLRRISQSKALVHKLLGTPLPIKLGYRLKKILDKFGQEGKLAQAGQDEIAKKFEFVDGAGTKHLFAPGKEAEYEAALNAHEKIEFEIPYDTLKPEDFEQHMKFSVGELQVMSCLFDEGADVTPITAAHPKVIPAKA